ncbi:flavin-containing monooxygenase [Streptacidiphilus monticola]
MPSENTDVVVVGAGQAGVAMSEHLSAHGIPHLVLERDRIAERWRTARWDSLVANGPAWHDRFPGLEFEGVDPDAFAGKEQVADYFVAYARKIGAPVRCGVEVTSVRKHEGRPGFRVETSQGPSTPASSSPRPDPSNAPDPADRPGRGGPLQIHSHAYRNPRQLPDGAVLVVGAGSSGVQIADELRRSGRRVLLSVGPHDRPPRAYRGRDFCWWLGVLGLWDAETPPQGAEHVTIAVSGARGGHTVDFRTLAAEGIELVGLTSSYADGVLRFAPDLADNIAAGDAKYLALLRAADAYVERNGLDLPEEPEAHLLGPEPDCVKDPAWSWTSPRPASPPSSGPPATPPTTAGSRSTPSTRTAARPTGAACPRNRASTSSACPGSPAAARASSGASGTTPATSPTTSPSSAATLRTGRPARAASGRTAEAGEREPPQTGHRPAAAATPQALVTGSSRRPRQCRAGLRPPDGGARGRGAAVRAVPPAARGRRPRPRRPGRGCRRRNRPAACPASPW